MVITTTIALATAGLILTGIGASGSVTSAVVACMTYRRDTGSNQNVKQRKERTEALANADDQGTEVDQGVEEDEHTSSDLAEGSHDGLELTEQNPQNQYRPLEHSINSSSQPQPDHDSTFPDRAA
ncbi:hypothetical protein FQN49_000500 [Arthroderma sp. PD_2]|nr:hypothetical protein FQN49_000500 [Arthroderma sp. PD_2]